MEIVNTILKNTCHFLIKTTFEKDFLCQEYGSGTSGHLMRYPAPNGIPNEFFKFQIYPDPEKKGLFRIIVLGWPDFLVQMESDRALLATPKDSDLQRFEFFNAPPPLVEKDKSAEWYYLKGEGTKLYLDFASHRYVFPSNSSKDQTKLKFEAIDFVKPDPNKIQEKITLLEKDFTSPADFKITNGKEWNKKTISVEAIPASLINDNKYRTKSDQIALSPYYYLTHEKLWSSEQLNQVLISEYLTSEISEEIISSFKFDSYKSIEKTFGTTFDASINVYGKKSAEMGVEDGGASATATNEVGATLNLAYQFKDQTTLLDTETRSQEENIKKAIKFTYKKPEKGDEKDFYLRFWLIVDRYILEDSKGNEIGRWDHTNEKNFKVQKIK